MNQPNLNDISEQDLELDSFACPRCELIFCSTADVFFHMRETHKNPSICHLCNRDLKSLTNLLSHSYLHKNIKPYKCITPGCTYSSRTKFNLKVHLIRCAGIEKFQYNKRNKNCKLRVIDRGSISDSNSKPRKKRESTKSMTVDITDDIKDSGLILSTKNANCDDRFKLYVHKDFIPPRVISRCRNIPISYNVHKSLAFAGNDNKPFELIIQFDVYGKIAELNGVISSDTIRWIKTTIEKNEKIPIDSQILYFNEEELKDEKTMSYYNIGEDCIVDLTVKI